MKVLNARAPGKPGAPVPMVLLVPMGEGKPGDVVQVPARRAEGFARAGYARPVQAEGKRK